MPARRKARPRVGGLLAALAALGKLKPRKGRVPRQAQPDGVRIDYYRALRRHLDGARARLLADALPAIKRLLAEEARARGDAMRADDRTRAEAARREVDAAAASWARSVRPSALYDVARQIAEGTSEFQRKQIRAQVKAAVGVDVTAEPNLGRVLEDFAVRNVALIRTLDDRYWDDIRRTTEEAFARGTRPEDVARTFADRYDVSLSNAMRIARDQVGKLNAQVNQERQTALGVDGYVWRTMRDNLVRDEHVELEGTSHKWSSPPSEGHPGEPIQCRCYAEPDFSGILGAAGEGA